jgi:hypothetical protein
MYIKKLQPQHTFTNENGEPWPRGTIIMLDPFPQHCGFLDYNERGEQILLHKSKSEGPIISGPEGFIDGPTEYRVWLPESDQQADEWLNNAYAAIDRGEFWTPFDNCQDFVSKRTIGRSGSPTRDAIIGGVILLGGLKIAADLFESRRT